MSGKGRSMNWGLELISLNSLVERQKPCKQKHVKYVSYVAVFIFI
jgi:hypothetical protein